MSNRIDGYKYIEQELKEVHNNKKFIAEVLFASLEGLKELAINKNISMNDITLEILVDYVKEIK